MKPWASSSRLARMTVLLGDDWLLFLNVDPRLSALRSDPRFQKLARPRWSSLKSAGHWHVVSLHQL
jgi:hypothetical protein